MNRWILLGAAVLSWVGFATHNFADLPGQTLVSPETLYPTIVAVALVGGWLLTGWRPIGWALLHLVGGALISVPPLPILPFHPEQSVRHYLFHLLGALPRYLWLRSCTEYFAYRRPLHDGTCDLWAVSSR